MNQLYQLLLQSKLFSNISYEDLMEILPQLSGNLKHCGRGEALVKEGELFNVIGVIIEGQIDVIKLSIDGTQTLIQTLIPSYTVGIDVACTPTQISPYEFYVSFNTQLYLIPYSVIDKPGIIREDIRLTMKDNILTLISNENIRKYYKINILSKKGLREKIQTYLLMQQRQKKTSSFTIPFNREQLAEYLCVNRSALSHELSLMEKEGLIRFYKNQFTLLENFEHS